MPFLGVALLHVAEDLLHAALDDEAPPQVVGRAGLARPQRQEVRAPAPEVVFAFDTPAAVDDALRVGLQDELRCRLAVLLEAPQPVLAVSRKKVAKAVNSLRGPTTPASFTSRLSCSMWLSSRSAISA